MKHKPASPTFSVVIPAYNEAAYLPDCLQAVTSQHTTIPYEIIVVDNNSTDQTPAIAKRHGALVIKEKKQGLIFAKQTGCLAAKGKYIAVLDADNIPPSDWIHQIHQLFVLNNCVAVTGPYLLPTNTPWWGKAHRDSISTLADLTQWLLGQPLHIWGGNVAFTKSAFTVIGGYDTTYLFTADEIILRQQLQRIGKIIHSNKIAVTTSTRRLSQGAYYYFVDYGLKHYLGSYFIKKVINKNISYPQNIRQEFPTQN